jgi:hypothetical protein
MANIVSTRVLNDGPRNHVVQILIEGDGSGDEIKFPVVDPTLVDPVCDRFSVMRVQSAVSGEFGVRLGFGGTTEVPFLDIMVPTVPTTPNEISQDNRDTGGIPDPQVANYTGTIVLTTNGMDATGDSAQIHLELVKHGVQ